MAQMPDPGQRSATYEDLMRVPEHLVAEIIDGELITSPRPASRHARASSILGGKLVPPFDEGDGGPGGWWIVDEPELHPGADVIVPDLAGWRRERMPVFPDAAWFDLAPDWVCEVVSPSTGRVDRVRKMPKYAANDVRHLWLIEPVLQTLEVFRLDASAWRLVATYGGDEVVRAEPFDAIEIRLESFWIP
jgi:Uma2 family endonuclease